MAHHNVKVKDGSKVQDTTAPRRRGPDMVDVVVLVESGIFKNGVHTPKDEIATMSRQAAIRSAAAGEVEFVE